ncbi:metal-dependent transcriptional regulator [Urechidicola croceus]|uniref:Transcriptional regulator MntR n=1 Tax=Urechidicola croceus TaxID=1850246 RepID=A0A1D8P8N2_9FLAO|nr:metal-dependent transcriptional regulator [Urechidicola croceus]AOW20910.1 iron-dependent repressor [Urechidicola croceus]
MKNELTYTEENYLKAIFSLSTKETKGISTNDIAEKLDTKPSSVTDMIKKLAEKKLVNYKKYQGVLLSKEGRKTAVSIVRNHRLWEVFLVDKLDFDWDEVHELAEQLEHIKSTQLTERLDEFLGFPTHDPHGDPIPDKNGNIEHKSTIQLSSVALEVESVVVGVKDSSSDFLKYLNKKGIGIGNTIKIIHKETFDKSLEILIDNKATLITEEVAKNLFVKEIKV